MRVLTATHWTTDPKDGQRVWQTPWVLGAPVRNGWREKRPAGEELRKTARLPQVALAKILETFAEGMALAKILETFYECRVALGNFL